MKLSNVYPGPPILYQYLRPPADQKDTDNILSARRIKLSRVGTTNDPFDMFPAFKEMRDPVQIRTYLEESNSRHNHVPRITPLMVAEWKERWSRIYDNPSEGLKDWEEMFDNTRVLCLSGRDDGVLLWSHYAENHRGFTVAFDARKLIDTTGTLFFPVEYNDERPEFDITTTVAAQKHAEELIPLFKRKSCEWKYEAEWRALHEKGNLQEGVYLPFGREAVESIILGALIEKDVVRRLKRACREGGLESVSIKRARFDKTRFGLEIVSTDWDAFS